MKQFKTKDYSKFKTIPIVPFSDKEKDIARAIKHVHEMTCSIDEFMEIGTHYESLENRKQGIRKIYGWKMYEDSNGESYEIQIWPRPKLVADRIDN